ncbi:MAG: hypothetical protein P1Q69_13015 [Candidatus Thorarchaeota archaeon]|nr:hypothetical protein [Candidatus Thorarchaeota archaeon]
MMTQTVQTTSMIDHVIEVVKTQVRKRTARWLEYEEGARYHRCQIASGQALRNLEAIKTVSGSEIYRHSFRR